MIYGRVGTALAVNVGPVLDTDGAPYVTDDLAYGDFLLSKNGTYAAPNASATVAHQGQGHFKVTLTTADISAVGAAELILNKATLAAAPKDIVVMTAQVYDSMVAGTDVIKANNSDGDKIVAAGATAAALAVVDAIVDDLKAVAMVAKGTVGAAALTTTTITPSYSEGNALNVKAGDIILWDPAELVVDGNNDKVASKVTFVASTLTFAPAMTNAPAEGNTFRIIRSAMYLENHLVAMITSPAAIANSINERIKAIHGKLPTGDIADQTTSETIAGVVGHTDYGNAKLARTGVAGDTLKTLSDEIAALAASEITFVSPITESGMMKIVQGDDYLGARAPRWTIPDYPGSAEDHVIFRVTPREPLVVSEVAGEIAVEDGTATITVELPAAFTSALYAWRKGELRSYRYQLIVEMETGGPEPEVWTPALGAMIVQRSISEGGS